MSCQLNKPPQRWGLPAPPPHGKMIMKKWIGFILLLSACSQAQLECEPWAATDGLGRELPGTKECGRPRKDKFVGVFYFLWLGGHEQGGPFDITEIMKQPEGKRKWGKPNLFHWWGEPRLGYYLMDDEWVIAKHAQMLADAGVDVIVFDVTNAYTYKKEYLKLCEVFTKIRETGGQTPQVSFLFNSNHVKATTEVYNDFYKPGLYKELWFDWQDKPLLMTNPTDLPEEILDFFTIRRSWAWCKGPGSAWFEDGKDKWAWIDRTPQTFGWHKDDGEPEYVPVFAAAHPINRIGRSHKGGKQPFPEQQNPMVGTYFQEQWDRALELDPEFIFITGWNEWVAQRLAYKGKQERKYANTTVKPGGYWFIDQYSIEYSRDCEPMRGGFEDNYYYQMVANIRKFKGVKKNRRVQASTFAKASADRQPAWKDDVGDTRHRNHPGYASAGPYINEWGRNDIVECSVEKQGATNLVFAAETAAPLTKEIDSTWMNLLIRNPRDKNEGWEGFQFRVRPQNGRIAVFEQWVSNHWKRVADISVGMTEKNIYISVPRKLLGEKFRTLEIKWFDHMPEPLDILDFQDHGDTAPNNRFRYIWEK